MPTYNSPIATKAPFGHGLSGNVKGYFTEVTFAAAPTTSDPINFFKVPAGFRVLGAILEASDMDTDGTPTITLNVGDSGSATRLFSASTVAQAGTSAVATAVTGIFHQYTTETTITGVAQANATAGASGTLRLCVYGLLEDSATS